MSTVRRTLTLGATDDAWRAAMLIAAAAGATALRVGAGGGEPAASLPAAVLFAVILVLAAIAFASRMHEWNVSWRDAAVGLVGGAVLLGAWVSAGASLPLHATQHLAALAFWSPVVALVALSEEMLLRGVLFTVLQRRSGSAVALVVTTAVFALMHVPLYGWQALPIDVAVGFFLGGLRLVTGGASAPAVAHAVTDLAAGWLG